MFGVYGAMFSFGGGVVHPLIGRWCANKGQLLWTNDDEVGKIDWF